MMKRTKTGQRGSALLLTTVISLVIMGITGAYLAVSLITQKSTSNSMFAIQALYAAEAGASAYVSALNANVRDPKTNPLPNPGTFPSSYNGASYSITDQLFLVGFKKITVTGTYANVTRKVEVILSGSPGGVFWNAIFAGNKNPNTGLPSGGYTLALSGSGADVDKVLGDIYTGGDFTAGNGAILADDSGKVGASNVMYSGNNSASGANFTQGSQENLLLPRDAAGKSIWEQKAEALRSGTRLDTDGTTYIDVAYDLSKKGSYGSWIEGSNATQITDQSEPAHIFRENPTSTNGKTDRTQTYEMTQHAKNDFYIEDPTTTSLGGEKLSVPINGDSSATAINVQPNGNNAVYFVDGNLRVSAEPVKSYQYQSTNGAPLQMTYVVKGNISLTDNILYQSYMSKTDGVAYIAITDPAFPNVTGADFQKGGALTAASGMDVTTFVAKFNDTANNSGGKIQPLDFNIASDYDRAAQEYNKSYGSGNVYFGDPGSGTVEHFEGFLYAENNFYATNLDSTQSSGGTQQIEIWGNMTAGNQVNIVRDTTKAGYIPLEVTLDPLIKSGGNPPPALPSTPGYAATEYVIASWKQIP